MEPRAYITAYLERTYLAGHTDLTDAARELVHADVARRPEKYAGDEHGRALIAYLQIHERLMNRLGEMDDLPDGEFETRCAQLFSETRAALYPLYEGDRQVVDAGTLAVLLADASVDDRLHDLLTIERSQREHLEHAVHGIDLDAPSFWSRAFLDETGSPAERLTAAEPALVGWLHLLEAISTLCMASARYRAAIEYSRTVMRAQGYPNHAEGTAFLALARLEEEDAFFALARELGDADAQKVDDSPWYLLGRALLLDKLGRERPTMPPICPCAPPPARAGSSPTKPCGRRTASSTARPISYPGPRALRASARAPIPSRPATASRAQRSYPRGGMGARNGARTSPDRRLRYSYA